MNEDGGGVSGSGEEESGPDEEDAGESDDELEDAEADFTGEEDELDEGESEDEEGGDSDHGQEVSDAGEADEDSAESGGGDGPENGELAILASRLDQELGFEFSGSHFTDWGGMNEKWIQGSDRAWYFRQPDGRLYKWS